MPWIVGIDEAGYGPNLGPLVMTSVACRGPDELLAADWWHLLRDAVRRPGEPQDGRLLVEDSKVVYSTPRGLEALETGVLATLAPGPTMNAQTLGHFLEWIGPTSHAMVRAEAWYSGSCPVPMAAALSQIQPAARQFGQVFADCGMTWGPIHSVLVCPSQFNQLLDQWGSKGAVLGHALGRLLAHNQALDGEKEGVFFFIDKHGGRNTYTAMLQDALTDGLVVAREEGGKRSVYDVLGPARAMRLTFQPRADAKHFAVALASMVSKYLRELLMVEFNRFWKSHLPHLKPTAGYPGDAARFFQEIRPLAERLGISEVALWRRK